MKKELDLSLMTDAYLLTYKTVLDAKGESIEQQPKKSLYRKLFNEYNIPDAEETEILPLLAYKEISDNKELFYLSEGYVDFINSYVKEEVIFEHDKIFNEDYRFLYLFYEEYKTKNINNFYCFCSKERLKNNITNRNLYNGEVDIFYCGIWVWRKPYKFIFSPIINNIREYLHLLKGNDYFNKFLNI